MVMRTQQGSVPGPGAPAAGPPIPALVAPAEPHMWITEVLGQEFQLANPVWSGSADLDSGGLTLNANLWRRRLETARYWWTDPPRPPGARPV